ncbi:MAG: hypothetical protein V3R83_12350 [Gammaproteobacteria bacterium]
MNYEGVLIALGGSFGGILGIIIVVVYAFWVVDGLRTIQQGALKWGALEIFNEFRWMILRRLVAGLVMVAVYSAVSTYRPRGTITPMSNTPVMNTRDVPQPVVPDRQRERLRDEVLSTDLQTQKTWDSFGD